MCTSPITIPNPLHYSDLERRNRIMKKFPYKDYTSKSIKVPCGHCKECIRAKQDAMVQRIIMESMKNHIFMCTLTYSPEAIPVMEVNGHTITYADVHDLQCMMKRLRKDNAFGMSFRYLAVTELGTLRGRPHLHILFLFDKKFFPDRKEDYIPACDAFASRSQHFFTVFKYWQRNVGSRRVPVYKPLCRFVEKRINGKVNSTYDFHYVNPFITKSGVEDPGVYCLKYMFKPSNRAVKLQKSLHMNLPPEEYDRIWNIIKPRCVKSVGFGWNADVQLKQGKYFIDEDILDKLKSDLELSKKNFDFPSFVNPITGKTYVMAQYYQKFSRFTNPGEDLPPATEDEPKSRFSPLVSHQDRLFFFYKNTNRKSDDASDPIPLWKVKTGTQLENSAIRFQKTIDYCDDLGFDSNLDLLN